MSQTAWIFDLNKCNGCPTCVTNCWALWRNADGEREVFYLWVETKPGEGHPKGWEKKGGGYKDGKLVFGDLPSDEEIHNWVEYEWKVNENGEVEVVNGRPVINPKKRARWTMQWEEDVGGGEWPNSWHFYLPRLCNHCSKPACMEACKEGAMVKDEKFGVVLIDEEKCNGCKDCIKACPYKIPWFNANLGIAQKCIACYPRIEQKVAPACARACPARAVHFGYLDDENSSVYKLVKKWKVALPLHPEFGTQPNVYYIPPLSSPKYDKEGRLTEEPRIPMDYLKRLFGDEVENALKTIKEEREKMRKGEKSELMEILIGFRWPDDFFGGFTRHPDEVFVKR